jgi:type II secretory pathway component PulJ
MNEGFLDFGIIAKMDPMARRATASMEAMQNAIAHNNMDDVAKHIEQAKNALSILERDLNLAKSMKATAAITKSETEIIQGTGQTLGNVGRHQNTVSDYDGTEGATVLGVSRYGRSSTIWRPQQE